MSCDLACTDRASMAQMKNDLGDVFMVLDGVFTLVATYIKRCQGDFSVIKRNFFSKK